MSGGPDLFVVCKSCGSEVSPYITECPYCGTRLRKRAPKLERGSIARPEDGEERKPRKPQAPRLSRMKPNEIPGIRAEKASKPYGTAAIVLSSMILYILWRVGLLGLDTVIVGSILGDVAADFDVNDFRAADLPTPFESDQWKLVTYAFVFVSTSGLWVAMGATFLFGWLLERRHGILAVLVVFVLSSVAGAAAAVAVQPDVILSGGGPGALGLLAAWSVWDLKARRREEETESDMLGVLVIACILLLLPIIDRFQDPVAIVAGGLVGLLLGLPLARVHKG